jgi:hypothetical protein
LQVFGGVGLAALPMELITAFTARPRKLSASALSEKKAGILNRCKDLIEVHRL